MKENSIKNERSSIEEYVKILEKFSNENVIYGSTVGMTLEKYKDLQLSAEHILSDYKRVLKENESLQKTYDDCYCKYKHYKQFESISVQKIKDKIRKNEEILGISNDGDLIHELLQKNKVLQELLEKEK